MNYTKQPLTFEVQADQLLARGLIANRSELIDRLRAVSYYRLSGYLYPFRILPTDNFVAGTQLQTIWRRYNFDRRLRLLLLDAIERIEVAVRTRLIYHFSHAHGPFGHLHSQNLPGFKTHTGWKKWKKNILAVAKGKGLIQSDHQKWLGKLRRETDRSNEPFVKHFKATYGDQHEVLPLWMLCELMTCGTVLEFIYTVEPSIQKQVATDFQFPDQQLLSWTKAIFALRNGCAHHSRIWNRVLGAKPSIPGKKKNPVWHVAPTFDNDRVGFMMTICFQWLGKISSTTKWRGRLFDLFDEYPEIPLSEMGIPTGWRNHPLWQ